jgi:hypothetical protein
MEENVALKVDNRRPDYTASSRRRTMVGMYDTPVKYPNLA